MTITRRKMAVTSASLATLAILMTATGPTTVPLTAEQLNQQQIAIQAETHERSRATEAATERHKALDEAKLTVDIAAATAETAAAHLPEASLADLRQAKDELDALVETTPPVIVITTKTITHAALPIPSDLPPLDIPAVVAEATANTTAAPERATTVTLPPAAQATLEPATAAEEPNTTNQPEPIAVVHLEVDPGTPTTEPLKELTTEAVGNSQSISAAAQKVATLTEQVTQATEHAIAAEQERLAAEQAAIEQAAAEQAAIEQAAADAAAERDRKIKAVAASPNGQISRDLLCEIPFSPGQLIRCDAADALVALNNKFTAEHGYSLSVSSSYRSYTSQVNVKQAKGYLAAPPGTSNHGLALAVDLSNLGGESNFSHPHYKWMQANAAEFGWKHPAALGPGGSGPQEPWHWEFGL